jgi:hypothetical protein
MKYLAARYCRFPKPAAILETTYGTLPAESEMDSERVRESPAPGQPASPAKR